MTVPATGVIAARYEALRTAVLTHRTNGERRGLALFLRDGMVAWVDHWIPCVPTDATNASCDPVPLRDGSNGASSAIVSLLATMAMSTLQERPS